MGGRNQTYESFTQSQSHLGIVKAIGSLNCEEELPVCFVKEPNSNDESALSFHLSRRLKDTNAAFTIIHGLTITFVRYANDSIILMDSPLHLPKGALLAVSRQ